MKKMFYGFFLVAFLSMFPMVINAMPSHEDQLRREAIFQEIKELFPELDIVVMDPIPKDEFLSTQSEFLGIQRGDVVNIKDFQCLDEFRAELIAFFQSFYTDYDDVDLDYDDSDDNYLQGRFHWRGTAFASLYFGTAHPASSQPHLQFNMLYMRRGHRVRLMALRGM